jgi:hypothetical protein
VDQALLELVECIFNPHRNPLRLVEDVEQSYDDKYGLINRLTNTALIAQMNCLERMGLTVDILQSI